MKTYTITVTINNATEGEADIVRDELTNAIQDGIDSGHFGAVSPDVGDVEETP